MILVDSVHLCIPFDLFQRSLGGLEFAVIPSGMYTHSAALGVLVTIYNPFEADAKCLKYSC